MVWLPGGRFRMGSDAHHRAEAPAPEGAVSGFWIDRTPVINRQFAAIVEETGHVTLADAGPNAADGPGARPWLLTPASLVFMATAGGCRSMTGASGGP